MRLTSFALLPALAFFVLVRVLPGAQAEDAISECRALLMAQQDAWNRGDIAGFMNGYARAQTTTFISGDEITRGWEPVRDRYLKKYSDRTKMGRLTFGELEITLLSGDTVLALGHWQLERTNDHPHGRFTLILRRQPEGWRIVHDHTSAAE